jgi:hypothetical protein
MIELVTTAAAEVSTLTQPEATRPFTTLDESCR